MTLLDYANWVPLPAPLAAAAPFSSFTSPDGEVWVAKGGIAGGAWRRARDVLHVFISRTGTAALAGNNSLIPYDTVQADPMGLGITSNGFSCPIAGSYQIHGQYMYTSTAVNQPYSLGIWRNGAAQRLGEIALSNASGNVVCATVDGTMSDLSAGDLMQIYTNYSPAISASGGVAYTHMTARYIGGHS
jgi:hypothetical protein